jgi:DNA-binding NarL/FixJ family response regulator
MTIHVEVLSLWRGVLRRRMTLDELAEAGGYDVAELRKPHGTAARFRRRQAFIAEALALGESQSAIARFLDRERTTICKTARRIAEQQVSP